MHSYRVKEYMWLLIVIMAVLITCLSGCSSAPKKSRLVSDKYCHTSQDIVVQDKETVSSRTQVKCSDDPIEQYVPAKMGLAKDCYETFIPMNLGGRLVQEKIYVCQKLSGVYDVVDPSYVR